MELPREWNKLGKRRCWNEITMASNIKKILLEECALPKNTVKVREVGGEDLITEIRGKEYFKKR